MYLTNAERHSKYSQPRNPSESSVNSWNEKKHKHTSRLQPVVTLPHLFWRQRSAQLSRFNGKPKEAKNGTNQLQLTLESIATPATTQQLVSRGSVYLYPNLNKHTMHVNALVSMGGHSKVTYLYTLLYPNIDLFAPSYTVFVISSPWSLSTHTPNTINTVAT